MLAESDFIEIEREYCHRSLSNFAKQAWQILEPATELKWGWAVESICEHLEAVTNGEIKTAINECAPRVNEVTAHICDMARVGMGSEVYA